MNKEDFFKELRECMEGEISPQEINDSLIYYRDYIREEMAKGKTEEEVLESLGSPRLIARSIIDASEGEKSKGSFYKEEEVVYQSDEDQGEFYQENHKKEKFQIILRRIGVIAITLLVLFAVGSIITSLLPFIVVILVIYFILRWLNSR